MAIRLGDHVRSGKIDNTVKGTVTGELTVLGLPEPLVLELEGNAHPDLAGCLCTFENPKAEPVREQLREIVQEFQKGFAGDISAGQKRRVYLSPEDERQAMGNYGKGLPQPETVWKNILYLEWYSICNGRCVVEGVDYEIDVDLPRWKMSGHEIETGTQARLDAQDDFLQRAVEGFQKANEDIREAEGKIDSSSEDEFTWEKRMRENDKRIDALMDLLENADSADGKAYLLDRALTGGTGRGGGPDFSGNEDEEFSSDPVELDDEGRKICRELEELAGDLGAKHYPGLRDDSVEAGEFLELVVKSQTTASMAIDEDLPGERGFLLARIKREIALAQSVLSALDEDKENPLEEFVADVWKVRGLLVDLAGKLRTG